MPYTAKKQLSHLAAIFRASDLNSNEIKVKKCRFAIVLQIKQNISQTSKRIELIKILNIRNVSSNKTMDKSESLNAT